MNVANTPNEPGARLWAALEVPHSVYRMASTVEWQALYWHSEVSKLTWCLTSTETARLIRDGEMGRGGVVEVGEEGDYIPIATLSPPE